MNLVRIISGIIIISIIGCLTGCSISFKPLPDTVQLEADDAVTRGLEGIIVYINQDNDSRFYTAGWKNRENQIPADSQDLFKIASISKLYIAVAAAKLISDETLSLDKSLNDYLPELGDKIENANQITLKMMLQHRSGIPGFIDHPDFPWADPPYDNADALELVLDKKADFKPDKKYKYCNTNYLLIGKILDKTLGYSHHDFIKNEILMPLGLDNTFSLLNEVEINDVMSGYFVGYDDDIKTNDFTIPGGSMVATAEDVGTFLRALIDGSLLNEDEQAIYSSIYEYEHTGLLPGYQSIARYHENIDAVVVQFINTSGGRSWSKSKNIYNRIVKILNQ